MKRQTDGHMTGIRWSGLLALEAQRVHYVEVNREKPRLLHTPEQGVGVITYR